MDIIDIGSGFGVKIQKMTLVVKDKIDKWMQPWKYYERVEVVLETR